MSDDDTSIRFVCAVAQVKTMADGGLRVSFDLPESAIAQVALLMECKRAGIVLEVDCKTIESSYAVSEGTKRKSRRATPKE